MSPNRSAAVLAAVGLLVGPLGHPAAAHADPAGPLYRLVDTAAQRLATADATAHGVDPTYVRTVFTDQIHATEGVEYTRFAQWKFDPSIAPTTGPDLAESRATIDGFNKIMVDEMALQWNSLRAPTCPADLAQAADAVAADRGLDPLYRQALSSATRSYCSPT